MSYRKVEDLRPGDVVVYKGQHATVLGVQAEVLVQYSTADGTYYAVGRMVEIPDTSEVVLELDDETRRWAIECTEMMVGGADRPGDRFWAAMRRALGVSP